MMSAVQSRDLVLPKLEQFVAELPTVFAWPPTDERAYRMANKIGVVRGRLQSLCEDVPDGYPYPGIYPGRAAGAVDGVQPLPDLHNRLRKGCFETVLWFRPGRQRIIA